MVMRRTVTRLQLWIRIVVLLMTINPAFMEQRFAIEPQDQTAIIGSRVTLPCRVINMVGSLQWTKDDFALGTHRALTEFFRYAMIGSDEEGDFSLAIEPVTLDDDARYQCQVSSGPRGEPPIRSRFAKLTILVPPEKPRIVQGSFLETTEDSPIELECVSNGGKPPAEITWIDGLGNVVLQNVQYVTEPIEDSRLYVAKSIVKVIPKKEYHNTTFVCQAQNQADRTYQSAKITLFVKYAPKVTVSIVGENHMLIEGTDAKLRCQADANPNEVSYRWYINQQHVISESLTELTIYNISRKQHDSIVKCEARNLVGKSEDSQTLDITYGPKFRHKSPTSVEADVNGTVNLSCDVDGNPSPDITWLYKNDRVVGKTANLTLTVRQDRIGKYYCRAHVPGFKDIVSETLVKMKKPPVIVKDAIHFAHPGDNVRLECLANSVPAPERTTWSFNGQEIGPTHQDYSVLEHPIPEGIKSVLVIRESRQEHYGVYNCSVTNMYGTDVAQIALMPKKSFTLNFMLYGILAIIITIITLILIIICCNRREKKKPLTEENNHVEKQCKESDKSSNLSEMKLEMRTGSSASNINCESDYGGGRDTDSIITRVAVPLAGPVPIDQRYSNRYSNGEYSDPIFLTKDGKTNNGYVPYVDYAKDYNPPTASLLSNNSLSLPKTKSKMKAIPPSNSSSSSRDSGLTNTTLDLRYSATYGNPFLKSNHSPSLPLPNAVQPPPPPPYSTLRNGHVPQQQTISKLPPSNNTQYIVANKSQQVTIKNSSQATHV